MDNRGALKQSCIFYGLIDFREAFNAVITLHNRLKMREYEVYWLVDFSLINSYACLERIVIEAGCTSYFKK